MVSQLLACSHAQKGGNQHPTIIAHRGASGYLPEHTLEAVSMAHAWNVDYIEPDVVLTKDNHLVVLHDPHLDTTTNVAKVYPKRKRKDGRYYAIDFTLKEIQSLKAHERVRFDTQEPYFANRFTPFKSDFRVPTLDQYLELVDGLNQSRGKNIGIYVEFKAPQFHEDEGKDIAKALMATLKRHGYLNSKKKLYIQCFDPKFLIRLRKEYGPSLPLVQLIADDSWKESTANYAQMMTEKGIKKVSEYANGIGPWITHLRVKEGSHLIKWAQQNGMVVHPYTARADSLPEGMESLSALFDWLFKEAKADGVFTDFGDLGVKYREGERF